MSRLLLRGGRVVDPARGLDAALDVMIADGTIAELGKRLPAHGAQVLELKGLVVCPGFIDLHTHLREPGREDKETIASEVADGPFSVILDQVTNGVAVRMAVLYLLLGGTAEAAA